MTTTHQRRALRPALGLIALALVGLAFIATTTTASAQDQGVSSWKHRTTERLVVRGESTVLDSGCDATGCDIEFADGAFRGTPVGTGAYTGNLRLDFTGVFPNGEGGVCAPIAGNIVLGAGSPDRLVLAVSGDSCQDGAGDPTTTSFTALADVTVKYGTGKYAGARGNGILTSSEGADDRDRMTVIGRISL
jgi:hypothetical protein